ncbi:type II toxin-antitoxin system RelE/ParE family toxin [Acidithiobacillus sp. 'AMD consortium']|uniref:Type II toxin-antitoxin system RelE/ParE family toxin n=2 Tax=Acidithiobacillus ferridurans TaxID=1232575 RepID=A0A8X8G9J4_ACIFI|nr:MULTISPECIES: type II toxin-antitoxin system RelE/ParE family toxin [Acidithiobacillus]MBE7563913.1 type II toxin-antitoxin system RelE/ParE family toxin [Acidithiobacillus sp. HP-6]MBE7569750.1 type II toxin-antitoxin system RelE/ParE family toxin [Acidithiobacillus sp. HP-2]MBU2715501.1 type II toxin-antitoxin system RelE/ParE family toxin [Acidithiobacillus ferridurans]MBU2723270.1 type II toxin-antitoxin system RelE/ParE family toxin [Acidithiobacillus ferridurans]MBU2727179.1 type II t
MIMSFADKQTAAVFAGLKVRRFGAELLRMAQRKLAQLHRAGRIEDLAVPPGNRLEKLSGDRSGQWSMRINDQWRICFVWRDSNAWDVEIVDYH